ncbi:hypothetical protein F5050DRAFT_1813862 [Lentinula boryana]|uniref:Retrovirus-related Pol polyprotein from transposon TNT 1-94-like beta-barrel domain-containing protein n=1 Tax=Lentinula boryana TaxID=40481 RepID=A0ABQ8PVV7_9AGAR|nr:hypothetical protein F5050DRAFT_1813862 [Lentinula boryana]
MKKNCWAKGGGSEGKGPRWYNAPKGMDPNPKSVSAASTMNEDTLFTAGATIYDFSDYDFGGKVELLCYPSHPDTQPHRLGAQEDFALLSDEQDGNTSSVLPTSVKLDTPDNPSVRVPTFIDSGASHWCIRSRRRFVSYTRSKRTGRMATEGSNGSFQIEGYGIAEITVRTGEGSVHKLRFLASHTPSFAMNLLSLPSMDRKGLKGEWGNGRIDVRDPRTGKVIVNGCLAGHRGGHGLYQVDVNRPSFLQLGVPDQSRAHLQCGTIGLVMQM